LPKPRPALAKSAATGRPPICGREICFHSFNLTARGFEAFGSVVDARFVRRNQKVKAVLCAALCKFVAYSGRGAGDDGEGTSLCHVKLQ
jgi:hypothetical protein